MIAQCALAVPTLPLTRTQGLRTLDATPRLNLASFVTTYMEPGACVCTLCMTARLPARAQQVQQMYLPAANYQLHLSSASICKRPDASTLCMSPLPPLRVLHKLYRETRCVTHLQSAVSS